MSEFWIRFNDDGRTEGPLNPKQLMELATRGYLGPDDEVGQALSGPWTTASQVPQLDFGKPPEQPAPTRTVPPPPMARPVTQTRNNFVGETPEKEPPPRKPLESTQDVRSGWTWILSIDTKEFKEGKLLNYHNAEYPALAAAIRYYTVVTKVLFYILTILWFLSLLYAVGCFLFLFVSAINSTNPVGTTAGVIGLGLPLFTIIELILLISVNLFYVLSIAGCEATVAFLSIEKSVRTSSTTEFELP
jgi:hypothetical protein